MIYHQAKCNPSSSCCSATSQCNPLLAFSSNLWRSADCSLQEIRAVFKKGVYGIDSPPKCSPQIFFPLPVTILSRSIAFSLHQKYSTTLKKVLKRRLRPGLCPTPGWVSSQRSPDPPVGWGGEHPPQFPVPTPTRLRCLDIDISS